MLDAGGGRGDSGGVGLRLGFDAEGGDCQGMNTDLDFVGELSSTGSQT